MKSEFDEVAYQLVRDIDHFKTLDLDWNEDILFRKYDGYAGYELDETEVFSHPTPLVYEGTLEIVRHIDYPYPDNMWNVMSERMLKTLLLVGSFPHRAIPVIIMDTTDPLNWYDEAGNLRQDKLLENYFAVQLTTHLDIFDYEKSRYIRDEDEPDRLDVSEYVFKIPPEGLPPLFKVSADYYYTFISADARQALKEAKITGTRYISLKGYKGEEERDWTDTQIVLPAEIYQ
ncbi:MAG: hypothetical protein M3R14_05130 [Acidobacteriota bacterium]|nr:hypothetical protein [Acidobacteriota bacterium]